MSENKGLIGSIVIAIIAIILIIVLIKNQGPTNAYAAPQNFIEITNEECNNLYYDTNTQIVYIIFTNYGGYQGYGFMSPYYAPNGLPYKYVDNKLVEIEKEPV